MDTATATLAEASAGSDRPLVSIGIPTYNRAVGLRRTLGFICGQSYPNIEIVVSDNASPDAAVRSVAEEFAARDPRVRYFRQPSNIGPTENFRFVLTKASGDYFMWAADDDEWDATFIETCLAAAGPSCSAMTGFATVFRARGTREENPVPPLSPEAGVFANVVSYFSCMQPSLIYGLHPRKSVQFMLQGSSFDFYDCYFVLRLILESDFRTVSQSLYGAGVDTPDYQIKYADAGAKRLRFMPFFSHSATAIAGCSRLSLLERLLLLARLARMTLGLRKYHNRSRRQADRTAQDQAGS